MNNFNDIIDCIWLENHYYMLKKNSIEIYDENLNCIEKFNTDKSYSAITHNSEENNFYLTPTNNNQTIYESNNLKFFKPIKLNLPVDCLGDIKHLSYCKCFNSLLITTRKKVFMFNLRTKRVKSIFEVKEEITSFNDCMGPLWCDINSRIHLISAICCCKDIYVVYRLGKFSLIGKLVKGKLDKVVYRTFNFIKSIFIINHELWILVIKSDHQELIFTGIECYCRSKSPENCKCQIIESIASIENSIAEILSSESLKIKAAIKKTDNIEDLICINSSVSEVIYYVTILEFMLTEKLKKVNINKCDCSK